MHAVHQYAPDVAQLLLDLADGLEVGGSVEGVATHEEEFDEVAGDITTSNVQSPCQMRECEAVVYGDNVSDTISRVDNNTSSQT